MGNNIAMSSFGATARAIGALILGYLRLASALRMDLSPTVHRSLFPNDRRHRVPLAILRKVPGRLGREGAPRDMEIFPEDPEWMSKVRLILCAASTLQWLRLLSCDSHRDLWSAGGELIVYTAAM